MTIRLYLEDAYLDRCVAEVVSATSAGVILDRTVFYPGGGGQPHDHGVIRVGAAEAQVTRVELTDDGEIRHHISRALAVGARVDCVIDWPYRYALMRHHALMHVVNTVAFRRFGAMITGVRLGPDRSRIDFRFETFDRSRLSEFADAVNVMLRSDARISDRHVTEREFFERPELTRTLNVVPPIRDGMVRIVEIDGLDAQACGGTHVRRLGEVGTAVISGYDNKGAVNKRMYWSLIEQGDPSVA